MLQKPNTVFVSTGTDVDGAAVANGKVYLVNAATGAPIDYTSSIASTVDAIQIAFKTAAGVKKSAPIKKNMIKSITANNECAYVAKTTSTVTFDFTGVTPVAGYRYVVRVIYKDLYEHPGQYTHSYEHIATAADTTSTIAASITAKINAHPGARSTAVATGPVIVVTAKQIEANLNSMMGKEGISLYDQVQMTGVAYYTIPNSAFSSHTAIPGMDITVVAAKPGKGNPYIVRDREQAALAYKGITYRTTWPIIKPELNVDLSKNYDTLVIEFAQAYQSPDNQYVKSTDLAVEVYGDTAATGQIEGMRDAIATWAGL